MRAWAFYFIFYSFGYMIWMHILRTCFWTINLSCYIVIQLFLFCFVFCQGGSNILPYLREMQHKSSFMVIIWYQSTPSQFYWFYFTQKVLTCQHTFYIKIQKTKTATINCVVSQMVKRQHSWCFSSLSDPSKAVKKQKLLYKIRVNEKDHHNSNTTAILFC